MLTVEMATEIYNEIRVTICEKKMKGKEETKPEFQGKGKE
jgi:hypothetical protein